METLMEVTRGLIDAYGYVGIFLLTTIEHFIFPIPADLFIGMGTSSGLSLSPIVALVLAGALIGSAIGYFLGKKLGHPVAVWLFGKKNIEKGEAFMKKWGLLGVILAGLTPIPFKAITWLAGIFEMPFWRFMLGVVIGRMPRYILVAYAGSLFFQGKLHMSPEIGAMLLGGLQGMTEFLPISSSGHLVIMEHFLKLPMSAETMLTFDIFLHGGSLLAIIIYFREDWLNMLKGAWESTKKLKVDMKSLEVKLALGTVPAIIAALAFGDVLEGPLRNLHSVAGFFILVAMVFFYVSWRERRLKLWSSDLNLKRAIIIGCAQAFALIPGVSRAGSTIAAGIFMGIPREQAARFSFMLGGVAILAANVYALLSLGGAPMPDAKLALLGFGASFIVSLGAISFFLNFIKKHSLMAFGVYLLLAGVGILSFL